MKFLSSKTLLPSEYRWNLSLQNHSPLPQSQFFPIMSLLPPSIIIIISLMIWTLLVFLPFSSLIPMSNRNLHHENISQISTPREIIPIVPSVTSGQVTSAPLTHILGMHPLQPILYAHTYTYTILYLSQVRRVLKPIWKCNSNAPILELWFICSAHFMTTWLRHQVSSYFIVLGVIWASSSWFSVNCFTSEKLVTVRLFPENLESLPSLKVFSPTLFVIISVASPFIFIALCYNIFIQCYTHQCV